jgi:hypothetical protein
MNTLVLDYGTDLERIEEIFESADERKPVDGLGFVLQYTIDKSPEGRIEVCVTYIPEAASND